MIQDHRDQLQTNYVKLKDDLEVDSAVVRLFSLQVFSRDMMEEIMAMPVRIYHVLKLRLLLITC